MKTWIEFRLLEEWANRQYGTSLGEPMGDPGEPVFVRKVVLEVGDPRLLDLKARLDRDRYPPAILIDREYTPVELSCAHLFHLVITDFFHDDACGEDFGTEYDDSNACPVCGAGRVQRSPLRLDLSLAPAGVDIVRTIAMDEVIVSQRLVDLLHTRGITGYRVEEVEHVGKKKPKGIWFQLVMTGKAGPTVAPTRFGHNYFEDDPPGTSTCPEHLLSGSNLLSEVFVRRKNLDNVDVAATSNRTGGERSGVLVPYPLILASPRFYRLATEQAIRGCRFEVAHIVD